MCWIIYWLLDLLAGLCIGLAVGWRFAIRVAKNKDRRVKMFSGYFYTLDHWLTLHRRQISVGEWLARTKGIHHVALYGIGILGRQFVAEFSTGPVQIAYAIDQQAGKSEHTFPVYSLSQMLPQTELVIVTPFYDFDKIKASLQGKVNCPIVSAESLIKECCIDVAQS